MTEPKPRRSIFDTLKKSADGRLGLAEAARVADKISVFPHPKKNDPTLDSKNDPTFDPAHDLTQQSDHDPTHEPTPVGTPVPTPVPTGAPTHDPTYDLTVKHDPTIDPTGDPTIRKLIRSLSANKRRFLHFIIDNEPANEDYILNRQTVVKGLNLTDISVKRYFAEFAELGFFRKETYRHGICQGVRLFLVRSRCQAFKQYDPTHDPTVASSTQTGPINDPPVAPTNDPTPFNEDRKRKTLSISLSAERIALTWPNLARAGFGREQLDQIAAALAELGKPTDKIVQSLDHAEWELERGQMLDKDSQPVADPCSWVFTALARTGYYRRPKGYVSPEEQAAKDAEAEAKAVVAARQAAEQAQFEAWRDGLSPDELAAALRGHPGGPKDAWLKKIWRDRRN